MCRINLSTRMIINHSPRPDYSCITASHPANNNNKTEKVLTHISTVLNIVFEINPKLLNLARNDVIQTLAESDVWPICIGKSKINQPTGCQKYESGSFLLGVLLNWLCDSNYSHEQPISRNVKLQYLKAKINFFSR